MKRPGAAILAAGLLAGAAWWARAETPMPAVGERAPEFALLGSDNRAHGLGAHREKQPVVLAFFPKAFTAG
jgi:thioredoxin-dependent peroxiredoxin